MSADSLSPAWQPALAHSRYLRQLLAARPAIVDWLAANAGAPLSAAVLAAIPAAADAALGLIEQAAARIRPGARG